MSRAEYCLSRGEHERRAELFEKLGVLWEAGAPGDPVAAGTLYAFSMHQTPDLPDDVFDAQVAELERELTVLKAHLETARPR